MFGNYGSANTSFGASGGAFQTANQSGSMFGQPQQPAASTSLFGGGFTQAKPTFGSSFGAPPNQTASMFGQQNRLPVPASGGIFSNQTATVSPFSATSQSQVAGTSVQFTAITGQDTMMKNGVASPISTRHQCITCMKEYENKSLEELRLEDYQLNRKGPAQGSMFGATQPQQSTGLFSNIGSNAAAAPFGQTSAFGTATSNSGGGLFSSLNQAKPATSFFSNPATAATSAFGQTNTAFSFSNPTNQPTSVFGANNNAVSTAGGMGNTSAFSFGQQQPQAATGGLFGAKPLTGTTASSGFASFGVPTLANTTATNKPLGFGFGSGGNTTTFGSAPAATFGAGTGSLFSGQNQQQQAKPFSFSTPFSSQAQSSQPSFGSTGGSAFTFTTTTSAPTLNFGSGTNTSFGNLGGGTTNTFGTPGNTFSLGGGLPSTGFGTGSFNLGTSSAPGFFNNSSTFSQQFQQQPITSPSGPVAFATTPYKDSPLFYNLIANRNLDEMIKPTSPSAQRAIKEAARRRASSSISGTNNSPSKNVTFPMGKSSTFNRSIFDGFEDENKGISIDILSPKTSVKKLALKNFRNNSSSNQRHSFTFSSSTNRLKSFETSLNDSTGDFDNIRAQTSGVSNESSSSRKKSFEDNSQFNSNSPDCTQSNVSKLDRSSSNPEDSRRGCGGILGRSGNYIRPTIEELDKLVDDKGDNNASKLDRSGSNAAEDLRRGSGVILGRSGYYIQPTIEELDKLVDDKGDCFVNKLVIGRQNHGEIKFLQTVNVVGLDIDDIVHFRHKEVVVYPEHVEKPPVGQGLNVPAEISLERVWPIDKITGDPIKFPPKLQEMNYESVLRKACLRLDSEFISYNAERGVWTFKVFHFSKYSCEIEESEEAAKDVTKADVNSVTALKGLGGTSVHQSLKMLKSFMLMDDADQGAGGDIGDFQPPVKKSRSSHFPRVSIIKELVNQDKSMETLIKPSLGKMSHAVVPGSRLHLNQMLKNNKPNEPIQRVVRYLPSIKKKEKIKLKATQKDLFHRLREELSGPPIRTVPRVSFGPMGYFFTISNPGNGISNCGTVNINRIRSYAEKAALDSPIRDLIEAQVNVVLKRSKSKRVPGESLNEDYMNCLTLALESSGDPNVHTSLCEEFFMWELIEILWPLKSKDESLLKDKGLLMEKRKLLSSWLKRHWEYLFGEVDMDEQSIYGLLKKGRRKAACELAIKLSKYNLAASLAKPFVEEDQKAHEEYKLLNGYMNMSEDKYILDLISGNSSIFDQNFQILTTSHWFQYFALHLWYNTSIEDPLDKIVQSYLMVLRGKEPTFFQDDSSIRNVCIQLLKLYTFPGYPLSRVLSPRVYTMDCLDYKLAWLLKANLKFGFGYFLDSTLDSSISISFANQLEQIGLPKSACLVLKGIPGAEVLCQNILERNLSTLERSGTRFIS